MKKNEKWVYIVPAIKLFGFEVEDMMVGLLSLATTGIVCRMMLVLTKEVDMKLEMLRKMMAINLP